MVSAAILVAACWVAVRRLLGVSCALLAPALAFLLANLALLSLAQALSDLRLPIALLGALALAVLLKRPAAPLEWPVLGRGGWSVFGLLAVVIWAVTSTCQNVYLDDDFWIHFSVQGQLALWGPPARHPFFPEITLQGHYGRDLILGAVGQMTGLSPYACQFWQTNVAQLSTLALVVGLVWRSCRSAPAALLAATFVFMGINVGGRAGLLDTYQNNNALAYAGVLGLLVLFDRLREQGDAAHVLLTAWALGTYALVYETHFGLLGLLLILMLLVTRRKEVLAVGLLALLLASVQGGPIAKVLRDWRTPVAERSWSHGELNQHQVVKLTFPKDPFLHIPLTGGTYSRLSCAYECLPNLGSLTEMGPERYRPLWSWHVLRIHWLSTLLAPFSLLMILRRPLCWAGLAFWLFGLLAYLTPGLIHFGPVFETEYFRWMFAAGFAWSLALGVGLGRWLEPPEVVLDGAAAMSILGPNGAGSPISQPGEAGSPRGRVPIWRGVVAAALVLANCLPSWLLFFPRVWSVAEHPVDAVWPRTERAWVLEQTWQLANFSEVDYEAATVVRGLARSGAEDRILLNTPCTSVRDMGFDSTFAGVSGLRPVGHSMPWPKDPVGTPPFRRGAPATAFWSYPSGELLDLMEVSWVLLRPDELLPTESANWLAANAEPVWSREGHRLYRWKPRPGGRPVRVGEATKTPPPAMEGLPSELRPGQLVRVQPQGGEGQTWAWGFVPRGADPARVELRELVAWRGGPAGLMAPPAAGDYDLYLYQLRDGVVSPALPARAVRVLDHPGSAEEG